MNQQLKEAIAKEAESKVKAAAAGLTVLRSEQWKMFVDGYMEGFIAGAEYLAERSAGVWVRASKRLPGDEKHVASYHVKYINEDAEETKSLIVFRGKHGFDGFPKWRLESTNFMWLDPNPSLQAQGIEVLKDGIEILKELCQLKHYKDTVGKDSFYEKRQPELWKMANDFLNKLVKSNENIG